MGIEGFSAGEAVVILCIKGEDDVVEEEEDVL
jgi:hypothetical protein